MPTLPPRCPCCHTLDLEAWGEEGLTLYCRECRMPFESTYSYQYDLPSGLLCSREPLTEEEVATYSQAGSDSVAWRVLGGLAVASIAAALIVFSMVVIYRG